MLGRGGDLVQLRDRRIAWQAGFPERVGGRKKLCMVPCRSCNIYGTWRSEESGERF